MNKMRITILSFLIATLIIPFSFMIAQDEKIKIVIIQNPYAGDRATLEYAQGPKILTAEAEKRLGSSIKIVPAVKLSPEEETEYGRWNRFGLSNRHLGEQVAKTIKDDYFPIGFLANCSSIMGMLAGLQHSGPTRRPLRIGLVFIDAHGDFNTPETTMSGMLGGMPVAVAAGQCLTRLRLQSGLDPALPEKYIVLAGVRDTDPLEQERIDNSLIELISVDDIRGLADNLHTQMERLSKLTDLIYIHIDMDVLDPEEVSGHRLAVPNGPTSKELGAALKLMFQYPKAAALGIASYPYLDDEDKISMNAVFNLVEGALQGLKVR